MISFLSSCISSFDPRIEEIDRKLAEEYTGIEACCEETIELSRSTQNITIGGIHTKYLDPQKEGQILTNDREILARHKLMGSLQDERDTIVRSYKNGCGIVCAALAIVVAALAVSRFS